MLNPVQFSEFSLGASFADFNYYHLEHFDNALCQLHFRYQCMHDCYHYDHYQNHTNEENFSDCMWFQVQSMSDADHQGTILIVPKV